MHQKDCITGSCRISLSTTQRYADDLTLQWCCATVGDALEMKRQVADIYAAMHSIRQQSVQTNILDPPEDAKLRTIAGRRQADDATQANRALVAIQVRHAPQQQYPSYVTLIIVQTPPALAAFANVS